VLGHLRKKRLPQVCLDELDTSLNRPVTRQYGDDDRRLMGTIDRLNLSEAIAHLPMPYRTVLVLFDLQGYGHGEIARIMNWSVANSKLQLHRARRSLRHWFGLHGEKAFPMERAKTSPKYERARVARTCCPRSAAVQGGSGKEDRGPALRPSSGYPEEARGTTQVRATLLAW